LPGRASGPGDRVGEWIVVRLVGAGASGSVHEVVHHRTGERAAMKLLHRHGYDGRDGEAQYRRLEGEASALAGLRHPIVVAVRDVGVVDGRAYLLMDLVDGGTLRDWIARRRPNWAHVADVLRDAAAALAAAHAAGLVHGDVKPDNIMITRAGDVRVTDFGLARRADDHDPGDSVVGSRPTPRGTPAYMAPERLAGGETSMHGDQYSLCVTFYESLYGRRPVSGKTPGELLFRAQRNDLRMAPADSDVPGWLHALVTRGLAPRPEHRHADLDALVRGIDRALARRRRELRSRRMLAMGLTSLLLGGASAWALVDPQAAVAVPVPGSVLETSESSAPSERLAAGEPRERAPEGRPAQAGR
jgi:eukaryotic-like serine/threonine-protein kinase